MLGDADVERYSRQILLPDVGGRGQERLCAARVAVRGDDPVADVARDLLARAGVRVTGTGEHADLVVSTSDEAASGARVVVRTGGTVDTWTAPPCPTCVAGTREPSLDAGPLAAAGTLALGALAASEALVAVLGLRASGRRQTIDLVAGVFTGTTLAPRPECPTCAAVA